MNIFATLSIAFLLAAFQPQDSTVAQPSDTTAMKNSPEVDSLIKLYKERGVWVSDSLAVLQTDSLCFAMYDSLQLTLPDTLDIKRAKRRILRAYRDSVRIATPRIIESFVLPDSLKYKRTIAWTADMNFNEIKFEEIQNRYNHHFFDYPFYKKDVNADYLGTVGSPAQPHNYFKRESTYNFDAADPLLVYSYTPGSIPYYNTKNPYTELAYWGTPFALQQKEELECKLLTTQNITPAFNFGFAYEKYGAKGMLEKENTDNRNLRININYLGKKYLLHAGYLHQRAMRTENGGVRDTKWITDTIVDPKEIAVNLQNASSNFARRSFFINHSLAIPLNFFRKDRDSLKTGQGTTAYVGHNMEITRYKRAYYDEIQASDEAAREMYFNRFYISPTKSSDSIALTNIDNKVFLKLQPYDANAVLSKINVGVGYRHASFYRFTPEQYFTGVSNGYENDLYIYAGLSGKYRRNLSWEADGKLKIVGDNAGEYSLGGNINLSFYPFDKGLHINARAHISSYGPNVFQDEINFNHHQWKNAFSMTNEFRVEGELSIPKFGFKAAVGYDVTGNKLYYDPESMIRQAGSTVNVFSASLEENVRFSIFRLDHKVLFQTTSDELVTPLPKLSVNLRYYVEFTVVKDAMDMQLGVNGTYYTKYYVPGYMPDLGVFYNQREAEVGGTPLFDAFVNCQWKKVCIFLKYTNMFRNWPGKDHFAAYRYIRPEGTIKLGIFWPF